MPIEANSHIAFSNLALSSRFAALGAFPRFALAASLGFVSAFSFAPFYLWPLMLIGCIGLVWLLDTGQSARRAAVCGWFFGFGHFATSLYWVSNSFQYQQDMPAWSGWIAVGALAAFLALYHGVALWLCAKLWSQSPARVFLFAASWAGAEWLRGHLLTGFPWNSVAQIWADTPLALQSARWFGSYGLGLFTVALFASLALASQRQRTAVQTLVTVAAVTAALAADGWVRLNRYQTSPQTFKVHLVQPNIQQELKRDQERQLEILQAYEKLTASVADTGQGIIIWPETAIQYDVEGDGVTRNRLAALLPKGATLIVGAVGQIYSAEGTWLGSRNSLVVVNAEAEVAALYHKAKLVPFGEYLPLKSLLSRLGFTALAARGSRFLPGKGRVTLAPGTPPFSPLICYEIIYSGDVVAPGPRPKWILNISNDAWFGHSPGPHQHLAQAQLRAVEEGLPVVRSTPTGISGVIDPFGRVLTRTSLGERTVLTAGVPAPAPPTLYSRVGDWMLLVLLSGCFLAGAAAHRRSRTHKTPGKGPG